MWVVESRKCSTLPGNSIFQRTGCDETGPEVWLYQLLSPLEFCSRVTGRGWRLMPGEGLRFRAARSWGYTTGIVMSHHQPQTLKEKKYLTTSGFFPSHRRKKSQSGSEVYGLCRMGVVRIAKNLIHTFIPVILKKKLLLFGLWLMFVGAFLC